MRMAKICHSHYIYHSCSTSINRIVNPPIPSLDSFRPVIARYLKFARVREIRFEVVARFRRCNIAVCAEHAEEPTSLCAFCVESLCKEFRFSTAKRTWFQLTHLSINPFFCNSICRTITNMFNSQFFYIFHTSRAWTCHCFIAICIFTIYI